MKLQFKTQAYQTQAVEAVLDCFDGQPMAGSLSYKMDAGSARAGEYQGRRFDETMGFRNAELELDEQRLLENIRAVQLRQHLPRSERLDAFQSLKKGAFVADSAYTRKALANCRYQLDVEMETGTGKTYCYLKSIFALKVRYGWSKFIVVVPSVAIREGVYKTLQITAEHFQEQFRERAHFFIYDSRRLDQLELFASNAGISVMVINAQAFNARSQDARRIYERLDTFQSRKPIDVIRASRPILILDEPQKMEGDKTLASLKEFQPLFMLRYSATHRSRHNLIHRLDALDAYNQKLVKKIAVRGIAVRGLSGTGGYLYLESIDVSSQAPVARVELEMVSGSKVKRVIRRLRRGDSLFEISKEMRQYHGYLLSDIDARDGTIEFSNGERLRLGEARGDVSVEDLRRIQIRETIRAHLLREQQLYRHGVKVLSLFFIDTVSKYRDYAQADSKGEYARIFEQEYDELVAELESSLEPRYRQYLAGCSAERAHNGYFAIDNRSRRLVDVQAKGADKESDDSDAYDLILKDKEKLLSYAEPTRFIFSHSALREGWDNPNVFVICALKHSDSTISRRQEVGRGLRLAVNQLGERLDDPTTVHDLNVLTVVASESYQDFVVGLQGDMNAALVGRARVADKGYFTGKLLRNQAGQELLLTPDLAESIDFYLIQNAYVDRARNIQPLYQQQRDANSLAALPTELAEFAEPVQLLIASVYNPDLLPKPIDASTSGLNKRNDDNFHKAEFQRLWKRIHHKAFYRVDFCSDELVANSVAALDKELRVAELRYAIEHGEQRASVSHEQLRSGSSFVVKETATDYGSAAAPTGPRYDLIGEVTRRTKLKRETVARILMAIKPETFAQFQRNPEVFIAEVGRLVNEQKASAIISNLQYDLSGQCYGADIFPEAQSGLEPGQLGERLRKHIYQYVQTDSANERKFVQKLDASSEVVVYAKLPRGFKIPTPVGDYNPDWAIAFHEGAVKHIYFVAETKGSLSSLQMRKVEESKIECARRFFDRLNQNAENAGVHYDVVDSYEKLMEVVR